MKCDDDLWEGSDCGDEGRANDRLTGRAARLLDKLTAKLARHDREAEQLAQTMRHRRDKG